MARFSDVMGRRWRRYEPAWWGNDEDPVDERWWFAVRSLSATERVEWSADMAEIVRPLSEARRGDAGDDATARMIEAGRAVTDHIIAALSERLELHGLYGDDGEEITDPEVLLREATEAQIAEIREVVEQGLTRAEGNA